jgi:hypothetical protein
VKQATDQTCQSSESTGEERPRQVALHMPFAVLFAASSAHGGRLEAASAIFSPSGTTHAVCSAFSTLLCPCWKARSLPLLLRRRQLGAALPGPPARTNDASVMGDNIKEQAISPPSLSLSLSHTHTHTHTRVRAARSFSPSFSKAASVSFPPRFSKAV